MQGSQFHNGQLSQVGPAAREDGLLTHTEVTEFGWDVSLGEVLSTEEAEPGCWSLQLIILCGIQDDVNVPVCHLV